MKHFKPEFILYSFILTYYYILMSSIRTLAHNSILSIHSSYYSFVISLLLCLLFCLLFLSFSSFVSSFYWLLFTNVIDFCLLSCYKISYLLFCYVYSFSYLYSYLYIYFYVVNCLFYLFISLFVCFWFYLCMWLNDLWVESFLCITRIEQYSMIVGIKLLLMSELMLFFSCFWLLINFRFICLLFIFLSFPLLSCFSFSLSFCNVFILLFSSFCFLCCSLYIKVSELMYAIESIGQGIFLCLVFFSLQFSELLYSYFCLSCSMIGSIYYFTTGLHGAHVLTGTLLYISIILTILL